MAATAALLHVMCEGVSSMWKSGIVGKRSDLAIAPRADFGGDIPDRECHHCANPIACLGNARPADTGSMRYISFPAPKSKDKVSARIPLMVL